MQTCAAKSPLEIARSRTTVGKRVDSNIPVNWRLVAKEIRDVGLRLGWRPVLGIFAALGALGIAVYLLGVRTGAPPPIDLPLAGSNTVALPQAAASQAPTDLLLVQIDGEVVTPGLYEIAITARLDDLVRSAGGLTPRADTSRINLAQPLSDSDWLFVPAIGEPLPAGIDGAGAVSSGSNGGLVNINTANESELTALAGIGPVLAERIVKHRETYGPFASIDALTAVSDIGSKTVAGFRDQAKI